MSTDPPGEGPDGDLSEGVPGVRLDIEGAAEWWELRRLQRVLSVQPGVTHVRIDLVECQAVVDLDPVVTSVASLREAVAPLGCDLTPPRTHSARSEEVAWRLLAASAARDLRPEPAATPPPTADSPTPTVTAVPDPAAAGEDGAGGRQARWLVPTGVALALCMSLAAGPTVANSVGPLGLSDTDSLGAPSRTEVSADPPPASLPGNGDAPPSAGQAQDPPPVAAAALPVALEIPALNLRASPLISLGMNPDGTLEVPSDYNRVGWYGRGPVPGGLGPAVLVGHVDSKTGPAVFFHLEDLQPGDEVFVTRRDGQRLRFTVERVERHAKASFPTHEVYGPTPNAALRLITCGGRFNRQRESYEDNLIVFANLDGPPVATS